MEPNKNHRIYPEEILKQALKKQQEAPPKSKEDQGIEYIAQLFLRLPYAITYQYVPEKKEDGGDYFFARVDEFKGCMSHGSSIAEARVNIHIAMSLCIESKLKQGKPIPAPKKTMPLTKFYSML